MALVTDLEGLGMPPPVAAKLGHQVTLALAAVGTAQSGGTNLTTSVTVGTTGASDTAFVLPAVSVSPSVAKEFYFFNSSATTAVIFAPNDSGSTLNGSPTASISVAQNKGCMFMLVATTGVAGGETWFAINSA